ncbi:hypothetical protein AAG570_004964 [Ranatra chinensis]|uniref:Uncharacterized protein n=1 Tax=Ranatra chinensis TaxID=642074 RepID=A0ABD0XZ29_9HEMI
METLEDVAAAAASSAVKTVASFDSVKTGVTMIMEVINGIPEFDGHSIDLQEFAFLMLAAHAQLAAASSMLGEVRVRNLYNMLVRRASTGVRADVGITFHTPVQEMLNKLKARYAGARRSVARTALKERAVDEYGASEAAPKVAVYEEIAREVLMAEMPDKIRRQLRDGTQRSLEAALVVVDDDEDEVRAAREEREWAVVENRRPPRNHRQNRRHEGERQRELKRDDQRQGNQRHRQAEPQRPPVQRKLCWTCGSSRHLSWACWPEPMEVNATAATRVVNGVGKVIEYLYLGQRRGSSEEVVRCGGGPSEDVFVGEGAGICIGSMQGWRYDRGWRHRDGWGNDTGLRTHFGDEKDRKGPCVGLGAAGLPGHPGGGCVVFLGSSGDPIPATGRVMHHIDLDSDRPVYVKPRRYLQAQASVIEKEIKPMLEQGVIRKLVSPFCSPLWVVPKPDASDGQVGSLDKIA